MRLLGFCSIVLIATVVIHTVVAGYSGELGDYGHHSSKFSVKLGHRGKSSYIHGHHESIGDYGHHEGGISVRLGHGGENTGKYYYGRGYKYGKGKYGLNYKYGKGIYGRGSKYYSRYLGGNYARCIPRLSLRLRGLRGTFAYRVNHIVYDTVRHIIRHIYKEIPPCVYRSRKLCGKGVKYSFKSRHY